MKKREKRHFPRRGCLKLLYPQETTTLLGVEIAGQNFDTVHPCRLWARARTERRTGCLFNRGGEDSLKGKFPFGARRL